MRSRILKRLRARVLAGEYVMTGHARHEMNDDALTIHDVETSILHGEIVERQRDHVTGERKYRVRGPAEQGCQVEVIAKIGPTGKLVVITVYRTHPREKP